MPIPRQLLSLGRLAARPLLVAQVAASLAGALAMVLAAWAMPPEDFLLYSLINLISVTSVGAVRAGLFQPALIQLRADPAARTPFRLAVSAAVVAAALSTLATYAIHPLSGQEILLLTAAGVFPVLHDWVRFRAMSLDRRWHVALADGSRLLLVAVVSPFALKATTDPVVFQAVQGAALALPALFVAFRLPRIGITARMATYRRAALLQLTDFAVGQFNTTVPLLILGSLTGTGLIAGVRFAQTLLGPLNLLFSANTSDLITDAANDADVAHDLALVRRGSTLARRLGALSVAVILGLVALVWASGFQLRGVGHDVLLVGLLLVGAATASSGWAGMHAILLRLLGLQGTATAGRTGLVIASLSGYTIGYLIGGVDLSVTVGFLTAAIASPLAFVLPARRAYRRLEPSADSGPLPTEGAGP